MLAQSETGRRRGWADGMTGVTGAAQRVMVRLPLITVVNRIRIHRLLYESARIRPLTGF